MTPIATLGGMMGGIMPVDGNTPPEMPKPPTGKGGIGGGLGGGGGSAQDGLGQVNTGASTIASAIGQAQSALGGGGGGNISPPDATMYKKGGSVKKNYTTGGKINLSSCGVSTAQKNKSQSNW
jgi:hypothetical protein